ncbi:MAG: hypothetical protein ACOX6S_13590 [Clostridia bacterium]|jgi:hypothetical protein
MKIVIRRDEELYQEKEEQRTSPELGEQEEEASCEAKGDMVEEAMEEAEQPSLQRPLHVLGMLFPEFSVKQK